MLLSARIFLLFAISIVVTCAEDEIEGIEATTSTSTTTSTPVESIIAYDFLYNEGVKMYLEERWEECVEKLELALKGWHYWIDSTAR